MTSKTGSLFNYTSSFVNLTSEFKINDSKELTEASEALETYNIKNCNQYPSQEKVTMSDINIKTGEYFPKVVWYTSNVEVGCGQFSRLYNEYSKIGQVDIYFRTPSTGDFFDIIHVYPNPVRDALSIVSLKEISNCKIEIFRFTGELIQIIPGIDINFDYGNKLSFYYELNLQNYLPGIYFVKVNYENKSHTFKIIKI